MNFSKILITGSEGQIGHALRVHAAAKSFQLMACNRHVLDITQFLSIEHAIREYAPDIIINTAAYTFVDKAEMGTDLAMQVNYQAAKNLAIACTKNKIPLVHLSTDYVFDGKKFLPYSENDIANPLNVYGKSKWLGEEAVREYCDQHLILRVSAVFGEAGNNFVKTILHLASIHRELKIVSDQMTCPTYSGNIAGVIYKMLGDLRSWGTYHYCDAPAVSWHEFACEIIAAARKSRSLQVENVIAISTAEYSAAAKRPAYSVLDCGKLRKDYGIVQGEWRSFITSS